jgi:hypothetical protein
MRQKHGGQPVTPAGGGGKYECPALADQATPYMFTKGIIAADETTDPITHAKVYDDSQINALVAYECNETSGGVTYIQNLTYTANYNSAQKLSQGWGNDTFFFSVNLSIAADGCQGSAGVNVNFSVSVYYPPAVWDALPAAIMANLVTDPSTGAKIGPVQIVQNNVAVIKSIINNDPTFGIVELLAQTLDPFTMHLLFHIILLSTSWHESDACSATRRKHFTRPTRAGRGRRRDQQ